MPSVLLLAHRGSRATWRASLVAAGFQVLEPQESGAEEAWPGHVDLVVFEHDVTRPHLLRRWLPRLTGTPLVYAATGRDLERFPGMLRLRPSAVVEGLERHRPEAIVNAARAALQRGAPGPRSAKERLGVGLWVVGNVLLAASVALAVDHYGRRLGWWPGLWPQFWPMVVAFGGWHFGTSFGAALATRRRVRFTVLSWLWAAVLVGGLAAAAFAPADPPPTSPPPPPPAAAP